jgi:hypothetical protein
MKKTFFIATIFISLFLFPVNAFGAVWRIEPVQDSLRINDHVQVGIILSTEGESINTLEGTLLIPRGFLVDGISDGSSLITPWIEKPTLQNGSIRFSGIMPGGVSGNAVPVFKVTLRATAGGAQTLVASGKGYLNDGIGTPKTIRSTSKTITISQEKGGTTYGTDTTLDTIPPETFTPVVSKDVALFDGAYFVSFETQDKASGIKEYMLAEKKSFFAFRPKDSEYQTVVSPAKLSDQTRSSYIFIKAIDNNNNERIAILSPETGLAVYKHILLFGILILCIVLLSIRHLRKK